MTYSNGPIHHIHDNLDPTRDHFSFVRSLLHERDGRLLILGRIVSAIQQWDTTSGLEVDVLVIWGKPIESKRLRTRLLESR